MRQHPRFGKLVEYGGGIVAGLGGVGCNFLIQLALARFLGAANFGQFALWRNNVQLAAGLGGFSIHTLSLKTLAIAKDQAAPETINRYQRNASLLVIALSSLLALLLALLLTPASFPIAASVGASVSLALLALWAASHRALHGGVIAIFAERTLQPLVFLLCIMGALAGLFSTNAQGFAWWFLGASTLAVGGVFVLSYRHRHSARDGSDNANDIAKPKRILRNAAPFFLVSISGFLSARIPLIFGGFILSASELGQLAFMISLAGLVSVIMFTTNLVAGPKIASAHGKGDYRAAYAEVRMARWLVAGLGTVAATGIWLAIPLFTWITNDPDLIVHPVLLLFLAANLLSIVLAVPALFLQMTGHERKLALVANTAVAAKIVILYPLGAAYGVAGFAIAEIAQAAVAGAGIAWTYRQVTRQSS